MQDKKVKFTFAAPLPAGIPSHLSHILLVLGENWFCSIFDYESNLSVMMMTVQSKIYIHDNNDPFGKLLFGQLQ